ncbi:host cell division inhibitor Icd-like protein [Salmonella enterica subsp. enterica serovar Senftenberg]|nr:host cell division inhibitor Icd-like protein [Salmonella enterica subsp. enterica serovar Senftenberg]
MADKTKAAMPGRQCNTALLKHRQITRLAAGGQTLSRRNPYAQINSVRLTYGHRNPLKELDYNESLESAGNKHEQYSGSPEHQHCLDSEVPTNNVESCEDNQPSLRGEPLHNSLRVAQNNPSLRGAVHSITESNPVQLSDSDLAFLRWRRLISPFTAVTMNCAFVSPSSRLLSKSATTSCGKRALSCCDLLLVEPVAIPESPCARCDSVYAKKIIVKGLKCDSLACSFKNKGAIHLVSAKPGSASTLTGPLTKPLVEVTVMAELQHTQTRPKYQYRFLALSAIGRNVIHITATTEREAREQSPAGCVMVFAGRLPVQEVRYA